MNVNPQLIWWAVGAIAVLLIIVLIAAGVRRSRSAALRDHFGREYDRTVKTAGSRTAAEEELAARAVEAKEFDIRPLTAAEAARFRDDWRRIEARFVERPVTSVVEADEMITAVMRTMGYPIADFDKYAALLSVKHPRIVEHYRAGHSAIEAHGAGAGSTENLRQAMLHYRALFAEMVGTGATDVVRDVPTVSELESERSVPREGVARHDEGRNVQ